jgi:hypothetical protein
MSKNLPLSFWHMFLDDMSTSHRHTQIQEQQKIAIVDNWLHITVNVRRKNERNFDGHFY